MSTVYRLRINGAEYPVAAAATDTLLAVMRDGLSLLGAKRGCNQGVCGACTVLFDGRPVRACLSLAANCEGADIVTIEGLDNDPLIRRLQQAFADCGAVQCGFCTPGMLISARDLLSRTPGASVAEIRDGLSGNLCRCSGYRKIVTAVREVAAETRR